MASKKYFFSPPPTPETFNNYIKNFYETLAKNVHVVNYNKKPGSRSFDFFKYAFRRDVMVLNWPEDVIHLRFGILQLFISIASLFFFKIKGGKIIWICHNKDSHNKRHPFLRKFSRFFLTKMSDYIVVHSQDAVSSFPKEKIKLYFIPHPIYEKEENVLNELIIPTIDVLIWGNITPYKGLDTFIENYKKYEATFRVMVVGKADNKYLNDLKEAARGCNITIKAQFLNDCELQKYFRKSKIILLPYLDSDTFSSGALIHSLNSRKIVIGPKLGNFIDLNNGGACLVYNHYGGLFDTLKSLLADPIKYNNELSTLNNGITNYFNLNSWDSFIKKIVSTCSGNFDQEKNS